MITFRTLAASLFLSAAAIPATLSAQNVNISAYPDLNTRIESEGIESLTLTSAANMAALDSISRAESVMRREMPENITAKDFITKVYGVFSPASTKDELCEDCKHVLHLMPAEDEMGLWLESSDGYQLSYYGQKIPDVSAMATLEDDGIKDFGFFFIFPYTTESREIMNRRQAEFCGSLLQEMQDIGVILAASTPADALFEISGDYEGNSLEMRLIDETLSESGAGRYILYLSVDPATPEAPLTALLTD